MPKFHNRKRFPNLQMGNHKVTSDPTPSYNCIAWAAGDNSKWWWPIGGYWPPGAPTFETLEAFILAFKSIGYTECDSHAYEAGLEKIAIYVKDGKPKHAARQLGRNTWSSKIGKDADIQHKLMGVAGNEYGTPVRYMCRKSP